MGKVFVVVGQGSRTWANELNDLRERWSIRRENPVKYLVPIVLFTEDVKRLDREKLLKLKVQLQDMLDKLQHHLNNVHTNRWHKNTFADSVEFNDAVETKRSLGLHIQAVDHQLSKTANPRTETLQRTFMDIAEKKLPPELFAEILEEARKAIPRKS